MEPTIYTILIQLFLLIIKCNCEEIGDGLFYKEMDKEHNCQYKCEDGSSPQPSKTFSHREIIRHERCGLGHDQSDSPVVDIGGHDVRLCCGDRDICYYKCSKTMHECENRFRICLYNLCRNKDCSREKELLVKPSCTSFLAARERACTCNPDEARSPEIITRDEKPVEKKPKFKVVERGTEEHKQLYFMPEDADEEEYIRNNPLPTPTGFPDADTAPTSPRQRQNVGRLRPEDIKYNVDDEEEDDDDEDDDYDEDDDDEDDFDEGIDHDEL